MFRGYGGFGQAAVQTPTDQSVSYILALIKGGYATEATGALEQLDPGSRQQVCAGLQSAAAGDAATLAAVNQACATANAQYPTGPSVPTGPTTPATASTGLSTTGLAIIGIVVVGGLIWALKK